MLTTWYLRTVVVTNLAKIFQQLYFSWTGSRSSNWSRLREFIAWIQLSGPTQRSYKEEDEEDFYIDLHCDYTLNWKH